MIRPKKCQIGAFFFFKNSQFSGSKKALITDTEEEKKSQWNHKLALDDVTNNGNNVANIGNIGKTMNRHMQQIDQQTGEVVEGFVAYVVPKRKTDFRKDGWQWLKKQ